MALYFKTTRRFLFLLVLAVFGLAAAQSVAREHNFQGIFQADPVPLMPFLDYYLDETMSMDVEEAASPARAQQYKPLVMEDLPLAEGITWLRFTISALAPDARPATFLLDMGQSVPGTPILYNPERNELSGALEWQENAPAQRNILLLPEAAAEPITCYIKIDGLPGPWFAPVIRTPQNAANNWGSLARTGAILALGVVMVVCLLRGFSEAGQWRIWTSLFVGVALAQALFGMPVISEKANMWTLGSILTPGIALMMIPHIGRHLLFSREHSRAIDIQLLVLSLPGAVLAVLPLIPGWDWLDRWLDLWPLGMIIFIPTALGAWLMGLKGSRRFLLGILIPPLFTALSLAGLFFGFPAYLLYSGPLWGVAICAMIIASVGTQRDNPEEPVPPKSIPEDNGPLLPENEIIVLDHPLDDPNLRLIRPSPTEHRNNMARNRDNSPSSISEELEKSIREPVDELLRAAAALGQCSLPPVAREHAEKMIQDAKKLSGIVSGADLSDSYTPPAPGDTNFNLQRLLREVTGSLASMAEQTGTAMSWHMPPHLEQWYYGPAAELTRVLTRLMESSVRASAHGGVRISVKRVPESADMGYLQFSVADNGSGTPPQDRSSLALVRAWEFAGNNDGYLDMESGKHGTTISFSMRINPMQEEAGVNESLPHIIIASDDDNQRKALAHMLDGLPFRISEAATESEILVRQSMDPAPMLIAHGKFALPSAADMANEFTRLSRQAGFLNISLLAITKDTSQWSLLKPSGFTHAMTEPVETQALVDTVQNLTENLRIAPRPENVEEDDNNVSPHGQEETEAEQSGRDNKQETEFSPTMIVEQDLEPNYNFDSPEWLNISDKGNTREQGTAPDKETEAAAIDNLESEAALNAVPQNMPAEVENKDLKQEKTQPDNADAGAEEKAQRTVSRPDPVIADLVASLESNMDLALQSFANKNGAGVAQATSNIAQEADSFGFRHLARLAQCVQRAATANDLTAVNDLVPDLEQAVERYCIHLTQKEK